VLPGGERYAAYELSGFDGSVEHSRPFPGFQHVVTLDPTDTDSWSGVTEFSVTDMRSVYVNVGTDRYIYGVVYFVKNDDTADSASIFIKYRRLTETAWQQTELKSGLDDDTVWDAVAYDRQLYVFIKGVTGVRFAVEYDSGYTEVLDTTPGPGAQLEMRKASGSPGDLADSDVSGTDNGTAIARVIVSGDDPETLEDGGSDAFYAGGAYPEDLDTVNQVEAGTYTLAYQLRNSRTGLRSGLSEILTLTESDFPSAAQNSSYDITADSSPPTGGTFTLTVGANTTSAIAFGATAAQIQSALAGLASVGSGNVTVTAIPSSSTMATGDTVMRVVFESDLTLTANFGSLTGGSATLTENVVDPTPQSAYVYVELAFDETEWDRAHLYRSVQTESAGGPFAGGILQLDADLDLGSSSDYRVTEGDGSLSGDNVRAMIAYKLSDPVLSGQASWVDDRTFDAVLPKAGAALVYSGTMLLGNIEDTEEDRGVLRWSSLPDDSVELFPPGNRWRQAVSANEILRFLGADPSVVAFTRNGLVHIHKEGPYIRGEVLHSGQGITSSRAGDGVGGTVYYMTKKGLKIVDSQGRLDDVMALHELCRDEWAATLGSVRVAYDPHRGCIVVCNTELEESIYLWLETAKVTHLSGTNWSAVERGVFLEDPSDTTGAYVERVLYMRTSPKLNGVGYVYIDRYEAFTSESTLGLMTVYGSNTITLGDGGMPYNDVPDLVRSEYGLMATEYSLSGSPTLGSEGTGHWPGCYVRNITPTSANFGDEAFILLTGEADSDIVLSGDIGSEGDVLAVSPVVMRYVSPPLGVQIEGAGEVPDRFNVTRVETMRAAFEEVGGSGVASTLDRYFGLVVGDTEVKGYSVDMVSGAAVDNVESGLGKEGVGFRSADKRFGVTGPLLSVGVEVVNRDLFFSLSGLSVSGKMEGRSRTQGVTE